MHNNNNNHRGANDGAIFFFFQRVFFFFSGMRYLSNQLLVSAIAHNDKENGDITHKQDRPLDMQDITAASATARARFAVEIAEGADFANDQTDDGDDGDYEVTCLTEFERDVAELFINNPQQFAECQVALQS
jgi:hypothetical protein